MELASCSDMETLTNKRQDGGHKQSLTYKRQRRADSPAAAGRPWLLNNCIDDEGGDSPVAAAKTTAASCTSSGKPFSVSFGIAVPPACCSFHFDWLRGGTSGDGNGKHPKSEPIDVRVIAGHDDAVLIQMRLRVPNPEVRHGGGIPPPTETFDYFLYEAGGGGGARPPSLLLLPECYIPSQFDRMNRTHRHPTPRTRCLRMEDTGILRRGEKDDDLVVCQFDMTCDPPIFNMGELCMLRIGRGWIFRRLPIVQLRDGSSSDDLEPWHRWRSLCAEAAVPVGNRFLCWVHYSNGFVVCDMADEENPKLRFVPLPAMATQRDAYWLDDSDLRRCRTLGAAGPESPDTVRFVSVAPPPCGTGERLWKRSSSSFKVLAWTMKLSTEEATTWVNDIVLNCDEIWKWRLPDYECLPCDKRLEYPMVSSDDPDVIYFRVEGMAVEINTRNKKLLSVVPSGNRDQHQRSMGRGRDISITAKLRW